MPIIPENDPNEAYEVVPCDWPAGWWTVTCNGIPAQHFVPHRRELAEHYARDPGYRLSLIEKKLWESRSS